jgi:hypothetical protein
MCVIYQIIDLFQLFFLSEKQCLSMFYGVFIFYAVSLPSLSILYFVSNAIIFKNKYYILQHLRVLAFNKENVTL